MQHILYIVLCTKKVFFLFVFKIMTFPLFDLWVKPGLRWLSGWYGPTTKPFISRTWSHENPPLFLHTCGDQESDSPLIQYPLAFLGKSMLA